MTTADWVQLAVAVFTALAAFAALATVIRAESDRRDRALPDLQVDVVHDRPNDEVRATVVNYGGPAREVGLWGVEGPYGYGGLVGPTTYWRPGESRTVRLSMPTGPHAEEASVMVVGRDVRMRYVFARTNGGAGQRWSIRRGPPISNLGIWQHFFPGRPAPTEVPMAPVKMEPIERAW